MAVGAGQLSGAELKERIAAAVKRAAEAAQAGQAAAQAIATPQTLPAVPEGQAGQQSPPAGSKPA